MAEPVEVQPPRRSRAGLTTFRKIMLSLLGIGVVSSVVGGTLQGTHSAFTVTVSNPTNTFAAGTLLMSNTGTSTCTGVIASTCGSLNLSLNTGMTPGSIATGTVAISNAGTLPATMTLTLQNKTTSGTSANLDTVLNLTIHDDSGAGYCVYGVSGAAAAGACDSLVGASTVLDAFQQVGIGSPIVLPSYNGAFNTSGQWAPNEQHHYTVTVELLTNATQIDSTAGIDFVWSGVQ